MLNHAIENSKDALKLEEVKWVYDQFLATAQPLIPFPLTASCLGFDPSDSSAQIFDGFSALAYDYDIRESDTNCLFSLEESLQKKEERIQKEYQKKQPAAGHSSAERVMGQFDKALKSFKGFYDE